MITIPFRHSYPCNSKLLTRIFEVHVDRTIVWTTLSYPKISTASQFLKNSLMMN